jgi:aryl-alcohol dehydrogenase-like predicted oxidoreductase
MEKRRLGKTDMDVSVLGFGGSEIGYEHASAETVSELLNNALDAGLNVIDTAECYYNSEELIGQTVSNRRKEFYLFTKCGHPHGMESGADWSKDSLLKSIERSLERLKTDRLDLVQLHSCSESTLRKGEVIDALQTARERGYARYIGYSGDSRAAHFAVRVRCVRYVANFNQHCRPGSDRFDCAVGARKTNGRDCEAADRKRGLENGASPNRFLPS